MYFNTRGCSLTDFLGGEGANYRVDTGERSGVPGPGGISSATMIINKKTAIVR